MAMITDSEINEVRSKADIVDIIGEYLPLTQKGKNFFGICPFHDDHNPSMSVSREKQIYTCFTCGASGNVYTFLMDYDNLSFPEAVRTLASKTGVVLSNPINDYKKKNINSDVYNIFDIATKYYQNNISTSEGKVAKKYLKDRDINDKIIDEFQIGLAVDKIDNLNKLLTGKGYEEDKLIKLGLVNKSDYGYNDVFRNRIIFPLYDISGKVIGYSGRIYTDSDQSKYLNSKETEVFMKGKLLYNYHRAKNDSRKKKQIILMEGFMDVIRAYSVGINNVVALMGTALTHDQALLIKKLSNNVILCFDGDDAGAKATLSAINELNKVGIISKVIRLKDNSDPDDYIKKSGKDAFESKVEHAESILDFKINHHKKGKDLSKNEDISQYINEVIEEINKIDDDITIELYLSKLSEEFSISIDLLKEKLDITKSNTPKKEIKEVFVKKEKKILDKYMKSEQMLLYHMLRHKEVVRMYEVNVSYLPTRSYRVLSNEIIYYLEKNDNLNIADFITYLKDKEELIKIVGELQQLSVVEEYSEEEINDYIHALKEYSIKNEIKRIKIKISEETEPMKKAKLAEKIRKLKMEE